MILERLHEHIIQELQQNSKSETVFVIMAVLMNIVAMAVNSGLASNSEKSVNVAVFIVLTMLVLVINWIAYGGLKKGQQSKTKLLAGLVKLYQEQGVSHYYDASLLEVYQARYRQYLLGVIATGVTAVAIPVIVLVMK